MIAHMIHDGVVVNTIVVDSLDVFQGLIDAANGGKIGDLWDGTTFTSQDENPEPPAQVVPQSITPRQGELILLEYGLADAVAAYIDSLTGQDAAKARIDYQRANEWRRDWPWLVTAATGLGLTSEQIDQMFIEASQL